MRSFQEHCRSIRHGFGGLARVTVGRLSKAGDAVVSSRSIECDALAVSGGFAPALSLFAQAGGKLIYDEISGALRPHNCPPGIRIAGSATQSIPIGPRVSPVGPSEQAVGWISCMM